MAELELQHNHDDHHYNDDNNQILKEEQYEKMVIEEYEGDKPFVNRVASYPVVASTIDKAIDMYSRCKESHDLVKYSLETAENGVKYVSATVAPVVSKFERPLSTVNSVACSGLDMMEQKCPIITKPTEEVIAQTKDAYEVNVKPSVDRVTSLSQYASDRIVGVRDYGVTKVNDITGYGTEKIVMARKASIEKLNMVRDRSYDTMNAALGSETGQHVLEKIDDALTVAESYVDHYLPEKQDGEKPVDPDQKVEVDEAAAQSKPVVLYGKTKQRLYATAMSKLQDVQIRSRETLERLAFTVNLIDYAKSNLNAVNERVSSSVQAAREKGLFWWDEIRKEEEEEEETDGEVGKGIVKAQTMEMQALSVARNLTKKLRQTLHSLNETSIPEQLRERVIAAKLYSTELAGSFFTAKRMEDLNDTVMTKAHEQADYIQETITHLADVATDNWPLNQLTHEFVIDELSNTDDEDDGEKASVDCNHRIE